MGTRKPSYRWGRRVSNVKFCRNVHLDSRKNSIEFQGHRSRSNVTGLFLDTVSLQNRTMLLIAAPRPIAGDRSMHRSMHIKFLLLYWLSRSFKVNNFDVVSIPINDQLQPRLYFALCSHGYCVADRPAVTHRQTDGNRAIDALYNIAVAR